MSHAIAASALVSVATRGRSLPPTFWAAVAGLSMLPDADVVAYALRIPLDSLWAHRGISHSLAAAALVAALVTLGVRRRVPIGARGLWLCLALAMASHGVIDTMTWGGKGVMLLAPFDSTRYTSPWRPMPASPIGLAFFSDAGLWTLAREVVWIWLPAAALGLLGRALGRARSDGQR